MVFTVKSGEKGRALDVNNALINNYNGFISGLDLTVDSGLTINIAEGKLLYQSNSVTTASSSITLEDADANYPRIDLIVYDSNGFNKITGTASSNPQTPNYDIEANVVIGYVYLEANETSLNNSDITDARVYGGGSGGSSQIVTNWFVENFTDVTEITVRHNLNDQNVIVQVIDENYENIIPSTIDRLDENNVKVEFDSSQSGKVLIHGGSTSSSAEIGGLSKFVKSFSDVTTVEVTHGLVDLNPQVQVFDDANKLIIPDKVEVNNNTKVTVTFSSNTTGYVIVQGGVANTGEVGGLAKFEQNFTDATEVTITHNLGDTKPSVQVYDDTNQIIEPLKIETVDMNTTKVTFSDATTGTVIVQGGAFIPKVASLPDAGNSGSILVDTGSSYSKIDIGEEGQVLVVNNGNPKWDELDGTNNKSNTLEQIKLDVTDTSSSATINLAHTNRVIVKNVGAENVYFKFDDSSTVDDFMLSPDLELIFEQVDFIKFSSICDSGKTSTIKLLLLDGPDHGYKINNENLKLDVTDSSSNVSFINIDKYKDIIIINQGAESIYFNLGTDATVDNYELSSGNLISFENINLNTISAICDSGKTSTIKIIGVY